MSSFIMVNPSNANAPAPAAAPLPPAPVLDPLYPHVNNPAHPGFVAFQGILQGICGITQSAALEAFYEEGYMSLSMFLELDDAGILAWHKHSTRLKVGDVQVKIPMAAVKRLRILSLWGKWRIRCGFPVTCAAYDQEAVRFWTDRYDFEATLSTNKPDAPSPPPKFSSFDTRFRSFSEGFMGVMNTIRGSLNIPLAYVFRDFERHTQDMVAECITRGGSSDELLSIQVLLTTPEFRADNARAWDHLRPLVFDSPAWDYVKAYDRPKNARAAFKTLLVRGEGSAAMDARRAAANALLDVAQLTSKNGWTVNKYINTLVKAYSELEACGVPKTEKEKVDRFVQGIRDERYSELKGLIIHQATANPDFQEAYTFLERMHQLTVNNVLGSAKSFDRKVAAVTSDSTETGRLPPEQWNKLSPKEKRAHKKKMRTKASSSGGAEVAELKKELHKQKKIAALGVKAINAVHSNMKRKKCPKSASKLDDGDKKPAAKVSPSAQFGRSVKEMRKVMGDKDTLFSDDSDSSDE
jgi:hypothetical protein